MNIQDTYNGINLSTIDDYVANKQEENLQLDFKELNKADFSHSDDKKNLAKAISGFSNSDGGIIVWGIKAKKNEDGIDCAQEKIIIDNIPLVISRLNELTGRAINPIVDSIYHKAIIESGDKGYVATLIPASISGPHMAKFGDDRYYKRSGDSFYRMEHYDIEDMFGRRKRPLLELSAVAHFARVFSGEIRIEILLRLLNRGRGTAKAPYVKIITPNLCEWNEFGYNGNGKVGLEPTHYYKTGKFAIFSSGSDMVIHPNVQIEITRLNLLLHQNNLKNEIRNIEIEYTTTAEDISMNTAKYIVSAESIIEILSKNNIKVNS